MIFNNNI